MKIDDTASQLAKKASTYFNTSSAERSSAEIVIDDIKRSIS